MSLDEASLARAFLSARSAANGDTTTVANLDEALGQVVTAARSAWPGIEIDSLVFARYLSARILPDELDVIAVLRALHTSDMYLACACLAGDPAAIVELDRRFITPVATRLGSRAALLAGFQEDLRQILLSYILLATDAVTTPNLAGYSGRGPLGAWVRVTSVRKAMKLTKGARSTVTYDERVENLIANAVIPNPELGHLKVRHGPELRAAFEGALRSLSHREGAVLQMYYLRGLTAVAIATMFGVHIRTVQRWVDSILGKTLKETRKQLQATMTMPVQELDTLIRELQSQLDSTLVRFFDESHDGNRKS